MSLKDLSYLDAFKLKTLRSVRRILRKGFTIEDIDRFFDQSEPPRVTEVSGKAELMRKMGWELKKPCGGCKDKEKEEEK